MGWPSRLLRRARARPCPGRLVWKPRSRQLAEGGEGLRPQGPRDALVGIEGRLPAASRQAHGARRVVGPAAELVGEHHRGEGLRVLAPGGAGEGARRAGHRVRGRAAEGVDEDADGGHRGARIGEGRLVGVELPAPSVGSPAATKVSVPPLLTRQPMPLMLPLPSERPGALYWSSPPSSMWKLAEKSCPDADGRGGRAGSPCCTRCRCRPARGRPRGRSARSEPCTYQKALYLLVARRTSRKRPSPW